MKKQKYLVILFWGGVLALLFVGVILYFDLHKRNTLADTWVHYCLDDGGLEFKFFWHRLYQEPSEDWHEIFREALFFLRKFVNDDENDSVF